MTKVAFTNRRLNHLIYVIRENPVTLLAFSLFTLIILLALVGPSIAPHDPIKTNATNALEPPSLSYLFGTDHLGCALGGAAGFWGGWTNRVIGRISDAIMAFPLFVLAMGIVAALGNTIENIIYATAIINLPFYIRVSRAETSIRRNIGYVDAARLSGSGNLRILFTQILPNILPPLMVQVSLNMGWAILNAAGLSFIGLGVRPPNAEWGIMVAEGSNYIISGEWWLVIFPGAALMLAVFCFNLLGDGLRDIVDPLRRT